MTAYRAEIVTAAKAHALDPNLVQALVMIESGGKAHAYRYEPDFWTKYLSKNPAYMHLNPERVSASYGLMQVMFPVAVECGYTAHDPEHLFVPSINLTAGCTYLARLVAWANGNFTQALAAYNGGKGQNGRPPYRNQAYATRVLTAMTA